MNTEEAPPETTPQDPIAEQDHNAGIGTASEDPVLAGLIGQLTADLVKPDDSDESGQEGLDKPEDKPTDAAAAPAVEQPKKEEKPATQVKRRKVAVDEIVRQEIERALAESNKKKEQEAQPGKTQPEAEKSKNPEGFADWTEEEREEYELATYAAQNDEFKGAPEKLLEFRKKLSEWRVKNRDVEDGDQDLADWVAQNRPEVLTSLARNKKKIQRDKDRAELISAAVERTRSEYSKQIEDLKNQIEDVKSRPQFDRKLAEIEEVIENLMAQDEAVKPILKARDELGDEFTSSLPGHSQVLDGVRQGARKQAELFMRLENRPDLFDPKNPDHVDLVQFINTQDEWFDKNGGDHRFREEEINGVKRQRKFLPRSSYFTLLQQNPQEAAKYWTRTGEDVLASIAGNAAAIASHQIKQVNDYIEKTRKSLERLKSNQDQASNQSSHQPPDAGESPVVRASVSPGAGGSANKTQGGDNVAFPELKAFNLPSA